MESVCWFGPSLSGAVGMAASGHGQVLGVASGNKSHNPVKKCGKCYTEQVLSIASRQQPQPPAPGQPRASEQGKCNLSLARGCQGPVSFPCQGPVSLPKPLASLQLGNLTCQVQAGEDPQFGSRGKCILVLVCCLRENPNSYNWPT